MNPEGFGRLSSRRWVCLVSAIVLGVALAAGGGCPDPFEREGALTGRACSVDAECDLGFRCDRENRRCVCTSDEVCDEGHLCNAFTGACVQDLPGCTGDEDCQPEEYCSIPTRSCKKRKALCEPCERSLECGEVDDPCLTDPINLREYCGRSCQGDVDCPDDASCQLIAGVRTCWPVVGNCESYRGCNPNSGQPCSVDEDCTEGEDQICDRDLERCVARIPSCPYGMVCSSDSRQCEAACVTDDDCYENDASCSPEGSPCSCVQNECVHVYRCVQSSECEDGRTCVIKPGETEGECLPDCGGDDALCPQGMLCTQTVDRYECVPGCTTDSDCTVRESCVAGSCVSSSVEGRRHCQMPEACEACESCKDDHLGGRTCQQVTATCELCSAPAGGCAGSEPIWCCAIFTTSGFRGIDCTDGQLCPAGHQCIEIVSGDDVFGNCFPTSDSVCDAPSCN